MLWKLSKKVASILQILKVGRDILYHLIMIRLELQELIKRLGGDVVRENKRLREAIENGTDDLDQVQVDLDKIGL